MPRNILNHAQFAKLFGGSRSLTTGEAGPASGYYVSRDPRTPVEIGGSPEEVSSAHDEEAVRNHWNKIKGVAEHIHPTGWLSARGATAKEKSEVYQGIWTDKGKTYLDVSDRIGDRASASSLREALQRGLDQKQLGVYAAGTGKTLNIHHKAPTITTRSGKVINLYPEGEEERMYENPAVKMTIGYLDQQKAQAEENKKLTKKQRASKRKKALGN